MKIYAKQVPPEYQKSPLFSCPEAFPENVAVFGNRRMNEHVFPAFEYVRAAFYDGELLDAWDEQKRGYGYKTWADALADLVPPTGRGPYTREERKKTWPDLIAAYEMNACGSDNDFYCKALEIMTGKKWATYTLSGCSQGDWQYLIYHVDDWSWEALNEFEIEYWNTGTEWAVDDENGTVHIYCTSWGNNEIKKEISDAIECNPNNLILQKFTGWTRTPNYTAEETQ